MHHQRGAADTWFIFFVGLCLISVTFTSSEFSLLPFFGVLFLVDGLIGMWPDLIHATVGPPPVKMHIAPAAARRQSRRTWRLSAMGFGLLLLASSATAAMNGLGSQS